MWIHEWPRSDAAVGFVEPIVFARHPDHRRGDHAHLLDRAHAGVGDEGDEADPRTTRRCGAATRSCARSAAPTARPRMPRTGTRSSSRSRRSSPGTASSATARYLTVTAPDEERLDQAIAGHAQRARSCRHGGADPVLPAGRGAHGQRAADRVGDEVMTRHVAVFEPGDLTKRERRALQARSRASEHETSRPQVEPRRDRALPEAGGAGPVRSRADPRRVLEPRAGRRSPRIRRRRSTSPASTRSSPTPDSATAARSSASTSTPTRSGTSHRGRRTSTRPSAARSRPTFSCSARTGPARAATVKTLVTRSIAFGHQAVVPSDPKGEWVAVAEAIPGGVVIRLGGGSARSPQPARSRPAANGCDR